MLAGVFGGMARTTLLATVAAAAALFVAPSALAKGPFQVCGVSGCAVIGPETAPAVPLGLDATTSAAPIAPAPYYVVRFADVSAALAYWIPSASVLRLVSSGSAAWVRPLAGEEALLREKTAGLRPYPAPTRATVLVDWDVVKRPAGYLGLYTTGTAIASDPARTQWLDIRLNGGQTPWNDGRTWFRISRTGSLLMRDGQVLQIPAALARRIRARLPLD